MALNVINHQSQSALSGATLSVIDPSTGEVFDTIPRSAAEDIDAAVRAARACFDGPWSHVTAAERGRLLMKLSAAVRSTSVSSDQHPGYGPA